MKLRAKVIRMRRVGTGPEKYGNGWATWVYADDAHCISGVFTPHPTHAEALQAALKAVGLAPKETSR